MDNYYEILQVSPNASKEVIEMAFKALAKKYHPDINLHENRKNCEEKMKILNVARDVLTDNNLRTKFDDILKSRIKMDHFSDTQEDTQEDIIQDEDTQDEIPEVEYITRPWVRYFARLIDGYFGIAVMIILWVTISPNTYSYVINSLGLISGILVYTVWLFVEALLLSVSGTTPGKWIFSTYVLDYKEKPLSFLTNIKRNAMLFTKGLGFGLPIVSLITSYYAYNSIAKNTYIGKTSWDFYTCSQVITRKLNNIKIVTSVTILVVSMVFFTSLIPDDGTTITESGIAQQEINIKSKQSELIVKQREIENLEYSLKSLQEKKDEENYNTSLARYDSLVNKYNKELQDLEEATKKYNQAVVDEK